MIWSDSTLSLNRASIFVCAVAYVGQVALHPYALSSLNYADSASLFINCWTAIAALTLYERIAQDMGTGSGATSADGASPWSVSATFVEMLVVIAHVVWITIMLSIAVGLRIEAILRHRKLAKSSAASVAAHTKLLHEAAGSRRRSSLFQKWRGVNPLHSSDVATTPQGPLTSEADGKAVPQPSIEMVSLPPRRPGEPSSPFATTNPLVASSRQAQASVPPRTPERKNSRRPSNGTGADAASATSDVGDEAHGQSESFLHSLRCRNPLAQGQGRQTRGATRTLRPAHHRAGGRAVRAQRGQSIVTDNPLISDE